MTNAIEIKEIRTVNRTKLAIYEIDGRRGASFVPRVVVIIKAVGKWLIKSLGLEGDRIGALEAIGGNRWQKGEMDRVYINDLVKWVGLEVKRYKTGNISYAELNGEKISNSRADKIMNRLDGKLWWDVVEGAWDWKWIAEDDAEEIIDAIEEAI